MSNYVIVRIPKHRRWATERLIASEAHVFVRGARIASWFTCARCGKIWRTREDALRCCASRVAREALLGEGEASCDRCGAVEPLGRMVRVPLDERGRMLDLCAKCARGERRR